MAPMADVTDFAFREIVARYSNTKDTTNDFISWTEFVSADGLFLRPITPNYKPKNLLEEKALSHGIDPTHPLLKDLMFAENQRPIIAQFFSKDPSRMKRAATFVRELGFDGIDINMGCPAKVICAQGAGSTMIKNPKLAEEIIYATKEGADNLPVSIKTRLGFNQVEISTWLPHLLKTKPDAITIHMRTKTEMSKVPANWDLMPNIIKFRDQHSPNTIIIGNGDIKSREEAIELCHTYHTDGAMIGRGLFGNPWFFNPDIKIRIINKEILKVLAEHITLFENNLNNTKSFATMKTFQIILT